MRSAPASILPEGWSTWVLHRRPAAQRPGLVPYRRDRATDWYWAVREVPAGLPCHRDGPARLQRQPEPLGEVPTEPSMAESHAVAARVVRKLKLPQSVASFQAAYTVTTVTNNVLTINVGAPSSAAAVQRASALATAFLQYRAQYARTQEQQSARSAGSAVQRGYSSASRCLKLSSASPLRPRPRGRPLTTTCRPSSTSRSRSFST